MLATAATVIYSEDFIQLQEAGETRAIFTCLSSYYLRENSFLSAPSEDLQLQLWTELGHMPTCSYNDSCESQDLSRRMKLA